MQPVAEIQELTAGMSFAFRESCNLSGCHAAAEFTLMYKTEGVDPMQSLFKTVRHLPATAILLVSGLGLASPVLAQGTWENDQNQQQTDDDAGGGYPGQGDNNSDGYGGAYGGGTDTTQEQDAAGQKREGYGSREYGGGENDTEENDTEEYGAEWKSRQQQNQPGSTPPQR